MRWSEVKFAEDPTIGEISVACALGYIDFRLPDLDWRGHAPQIGGLVREILRISVDEGDDAANEAVQMKIGGKHYRSVWPIGEDAFGIIDQTKLPHEFVTLTLRSADDAAHAIKAMQTRGAPLIGAVAAYGLALAMRARCLRRKSRPRP